MRVKRFVNIEAVARRKLVQLNAAAALDFFCACRRVTDLKR